MLVPNRHKAVDEGYRYGFQRQEKDDEIKGEGNSLNYTFRMYDPRVGRFFAVDPLTKEYPHYTPYSFSGNKVIAFVEREGAEEEAAAIVCGPPGWVYIVGKWVLIGGITAYGVYTADNVIDNYRNAPDLDTEAPTITIIPNAESVPRTTIPKGKEPNPKPNEKPKPKPVYSLPPKEDDSDPEFVYRGGNYTDANFTPRPNKDDGTGPKSGLSTFVNPLLATQFKDGKAQKISVDALKALGFTTVKTPDGHVGIRPPSQEKLKEWAATRPGLLAGENEAHILTEMVKSARVEEVKVKGIYDD